MWKKLFLIACFFVEFSLGYCLFGEEKSHDEVIVEKSHDEVIVEIIEGQLDLIDSLISEIEYLNQRINELQDDINVLYGYIDLIIEE